MASTQNPIDLSTVVTTPENIAFDYRIAGPFRRLPAYLTDLAIRWFAMGAGLICLLFLLAGFGIGTSLLSEVFVFTFIVLTFFWQWFYDTFFEVFWNGQTPGKRYFNLRVMSSDGRPVNAMQAMIRNLLRVADNAPLLSLEMLVDDSPPFYVIPTFLCGFACMVISKKFQRLGDLAAGTIVVVTERGWAPPKIEIEDNRVPGLASFIPANFRLTASLAKAISLYMERRKYMNPSRRLELAGHVAYPLMRRFGFREDTCPDLLLCAIYYREFVAIDKSADVRLGGLSNPVVPGAEPPVITMPVAKPAMSDPRSDFDNHRNSVSDLTPEGGGMREPPRPLVPIADSSDGPALPSKRNAGP